MTNIEACILTVAEADELRAEIERLRRHKEEADRHIATIAQLRTKIERLTTENWQLRQACGYPIPADKETPQNPFKCGLCEARALQDPFRAGFETAIEEAAAYIGRLKAEVRTPEQALDW